MPPKGKIAVCKVEYETKDRTNWKAVILAYNMKDAIKYLVNNVPAYEKYISTQILGDVDVIERQVFDDYLVKNETQVVETVVQNVVNEGTGLPQCPWCDKEFKTKATLGIHIKKYHME